MRFRRLNEQSSFLRSVREARRPIDDPIQRLSEPRVWLLTGRCSLRTYTNFDAVFYDWITSRLSAGFQCRCYIRCATCLISLLTRGIIHIKPWWIIGTLYLLHVIVYHRIHIPTCSFHIVLTVSWDQRFVSDCWLESVHSLVFHFEMNEHEWLSLKRTRDWNKRKKKNLTIECWMTTSNRRKNVNDNWRII